LQIKADNLANALEGGLKPLYLISGDELLIVQETSDQVIKVAKSDGFSERVVYQLGVDGGWDGLREESSALSLFASKRLIDVRLPAAKLDKEASVFLREWCEKPPVDTVLLLRTERLLPRQKSSAWFKAIDSIGIITLVWPVSERELPRWLNERLLKQGIQLDRESLSYFAEKVEGNLLSAAQLIEKLVLSGTQGEVALDKLYGLIEDSSRFGVFDLIDAMMAGRADRTSHVLSVLREEGVSLFAILGALASQIRRMGSTMQGIPANKRELIVQFGSRVGRPELVLSEIALIDHQAKGGFVGGSEWTTLERLLLRLSGVKELSLISEDRQRFFL